MSALNTTRWIDAGLLGLPLYGTLTFWSSIDPQPDPDPELPEDHVADRAGEEAHAEGREGDQCPRQGSEGREKELVED